MGEPTGSPYNWWLKHIKDGFLKISPWTTPVIYISVIKSSLCTTFQGLNARLWSTMVSILDHVLPKFRKNQVDVYPSTSQAVRPLLNCKTHLLYGHETDWIQVAIRRTKIIAIHSDSLSSEFFGMAANHCQQEVTTIWATGDGWNGWQLRQPDLGKLCKIVVMNLCTPVNPQSSLANRSVDEMVHHKTPSCFVKRCLPEIACPGVVPKSLEDTAIYVESITCSN